MKIKKIEIDINDPRRFGDIALLVDQPKFLEAVYKLRKKWKIEKLYEPGEYKSFLLYIRSFDAENDAWIKFKNDIKELRLKVIRTPNFDKVIIYAVAFIRIPDLIYKTCYLKTLSNRIKTNEPKDVEYAIVITPYTTRNELADELEEFKKRMRKSIKNYKKGPHIIPDESLIDYEYNVKYKPIFKEITNIIRDRDWYWLKEKGFSYGEILNKAKKAGEVISKKGVISAIKSYKERLLE